MTDMAGFGTNGFNGNLNMYGYQAPLQGYPQQAVIRPQNYQLYYEPQYVIGIEGANAFQMPVGVSQMILWDSEKDCFYVKKLDEMGRPKVVAWKDFQDHVEPVNTQNEAQGTQNVAAAQQIDLNDFATKKDLEEMVNQIKQPDFSAYLTKEDFEKILSQLCVGEKGKVIRNELNT